MRFVRIAVVCLGLLLVAALASAKEIVVQGGMDGRLDFVFQRAVEFPSGARKVECTFVVPRGFVSPTYSQEVESFSLEFAPEPDERSTRRDDRGNEIVSVEWDDPPSSVEMAYAAKTRAATKLERIETDAPFPLRGVPGEVRPYLGATDLVQSEAPEIRQTARALTQGAATEYAAASRIVNWVADHVRYVSAPKQYDALYSLETGRGNCQNYSHLTAALLRAVGAPARIVNGFTVKKPYDVRTGDTIYTFQAAQGRHSWIEVWFPDLGWVPFDPQKTSLFVSNRFLRIEVGVDNKETQNDGRIRWIPKGGSSRPKLNTATVGELPRDEVAIAGRPREGTLRNIVLYPDVDAAVPELAEPEPEPDIQLPDAARPEPGPPAPEPGQRAVVGNLEFPENVDFTDYGEPVQVGEDQFELTRNFMVETAEYVTTQARQYAQAAVVEHPMRLAQASLALHRYGGRGKLWVEVYEDADGQPGELLAASDIKDLRLLSLRPGYRWAEFSFRQKPVELAPGIYWVALGFTGDPVVNWFYTPGKPVGPSWGTRYKGVFEQDWSGSLDFEFNYRLTGVRQ